MSRNDFKKFRVSPENKEFLRQELWLRWINNFFKEEENQLYCYAKCSRDQFKKIHTRAVCERLTIETGLIHMSREESNNIGLRGAILSKHGKINGGGAVII